MDGAVLLWVLVPLAAVHAVLVVRRWRTGLAFQLLVDVALLVLVVAPLRGGGRLGPGLPGAEATGAPVHLRGSAEQSDLPLQFAVWWEEVRRLAGRGAPPWVSDRLGGGQPLYAHGQTGIPFPLHLPVWALGADRGTAVEAVWKLELAAWGFFLLLGRLRVRPAAAATGAIAYSFGLAPLSWLVVPLAWVMAAAPWALWLLLAVLRGRRRAAAALALLLGALTGWSVHPESALFLDLAVAVAAVTLGWGRTRRLVRVSGPALCAVLVSAVGAIPTLVAAASSSKVAALSAAPAYPTAEIDWPLRGRVAALVLVPWRDGHPADGTWSLPFPNAPVALSVGLVVLAGALAAPVRRRHRRFALATVLAGGAAALLVFQVPGATAVAARMPVLGHMVWVRAGFLLALALAVLGALGFDAWLRRPRRRRLVAVALGLQVTVASLVAGHANSTTVAGAWSPLAVAALAPLGAAAGGWPLASVALIEAAVVGWGVVPGSRPQWSDPPPLVRELRALVDREGGLVIGTGDTLSPNLAARWGLGDLRSADPIRSMPLAALHRAFGVQGLDLPGPMERPWAGLAGSWGVRWLVTPPGGSEADLAGWREVWRGAGGRIYRNDRWLPPVRLASVSVLPPGDPAEGAWEALDFTDNAVVETPVALGGRGRIGRLIRDVSRIEAMVVADGAVLAVAHVPSAPGWGASLDGVPAETVPVDIAAMGVVVPAGSHRVVWRYSPVGLGPGAVLTVVGLIGCGALGRKRRRKGR